ncbi:hypothetical protein D3C72_1864220 [compost metagenome]
MHQADDLIERSYIFQIAKKDKTDEKDYYINLTEDGVLFKYFDSNKKEKYIYDRYTIISEIQLNKDKTKEIEYKISKLEELSKLENIINYCTLTYAGEEINVDFNQINDILIKFGINF